MKTRLILTIVYLTIGNLNAQNINPAWQFVGPRSTNEPNVGPSDPSYNPFKTGQIDDIAVDPANASHIVVSSFYAGIWETYNYIGGSTPSANWQLLPNFDNPLPLGIGDNQVNAIEFRNQNELFAANANTVFKYEYATNSWTQLGSIPNASQININQIVFLPNDPNHIFLCTSNGLIESINAGVSWFQTPASNPIAGDIHSIVFIEKVTPGTYFWYIAGANSLGNALLMESIDDGLSFNYIIAFTSLFSSLNSFSGICLGNQSGITNDRDIFISTAINLSSNWSSSQRQLHRLTKNINSGAISVMGFSNGNTGNEYYNVPNRLIIGYDPINNMVITGGVKLHAFDLTNNISANITSIHDDYHAIYINATSNHFLLGCDGGFASVSYNNGSYTSYRANYGLDICQINGFSGATESNIYVYGQQDQLVSDLYDEFSGRVIATHFAGENDGGLIDKFDGNRLIISDNSSYNSYYFVSNNGVSNFSSASSSPMYLPNNSPIYYFQPNLSQPHYPSQAFGCPPFFQHPFRQNRIFNVAYGGSIFQFDPISAKFVLKVRLQDEIQHFTCSPTLQSLTCLNCAPCTTNAFLRLHYLSYYGQPVRASFSQLDKNTMYVITSNNSNACCTTASQVVQYIGNNLDDLWADHYETMDNNGNPQWQLITPDFQSVVFGSMIESDIYHIKFTGIESSNWDKNKIYVSCSSDLATPFPYKVITYDCLTGVWSNYSTGIPLNENITSMIMDHASYDGIYISTNKNIYYREPGMPSWINYNNGSPAMVLPYLSCRQMEINYRENTIRAGTFGRGIWKSNLVCPSTASLTIPTGTVSGYYESTDVITSASSSNSTIASLNGSTIFRATNKVTIEPGFTVDASSGTNYFTAFIHGCDNGSTSSYNYFKTGFEFSESVFNSDVVTNNEMQRIFIYPNPASDQINLVLSETVDNEIQQVMILSPMSKILYISSSINSSRSTILVSHLKPGIYFINVKTATQTIISKFIKL